MKKMMMIRSGMIALGALSFATSAFAASMIADGSGSHGGDPLRLRAKLSKEMKDPELTLRAELIRSYIESHLKGAIVEYANAFLYDPREITNPSVRAELSQMIKRRRDDDGGYLANGEPATHYFRIDVQDSQYVLSDSCVDDDGEQVAASATAQPYGDICFNPTRLATEKATPAEIVALAIHEHAHHFGFADKDNDIFEVAFKTLKLDYPSWSNFDARIVEPDTTFHWRRDPDGLLECYPHTPHDGTVYPAQSNRLCKSRENLFWKIVDGATYGTRADLCAIEVEINPIDVGNVEMMVTDVRNPLTGRQCDDTTTLIFQCDPWAAQCIYKATDNRFSDSTLDVLEDGNLIEEFDDGRTPVKFKRMRR